MTDIIIILVLAIILGVAAGYIYKSKKNGKKCIGCASGVCKGDCANCGKQE